MDCHHSATIPFQCPLTMRLPTSHYQPPTRQVHLIMDQTYQQGLYIPLTNQLLGLEMVKQNNLYKLFFLLSSNLVIIKTLKIFVTNNLYNLNQMYMGKES